MLFSISIFFYDFTIEMKFVEDIKERRCIIIFIVLEGRQKLLLDEMLLNKKRNLRIYR